MSVYRAAWQDFIADTVEVFRIDRFTVQPQLQDLQVRAAVEYPIRKQSFDDYPDASEGHSRHQRETADEAGSND